MSRMFLIDGKPTKTWNVYSGCNWHCSYCWARRFAEGRLKNIPRYHGGFVPHFNPEELNKVFKPRDFVFICSMGDIAWASRGEVEAIMDRVRMFPLTTFLMTTKAPNIFLEWQEEWGFEPTLNLYLGTTIESNYDHGVTKAPAPEKRYRAMLQLDHPRKFISIEPLMDFHLGTLVAWMKDINPDIIEIGADNYGNNLPEPKSAITGFKSPWKVRMLADMLRDFCPDVVEKPGLSRLMV